MRLLSYNIHKGIGGLDRRYQIERIIAVIEEQNPDIICLQEVDLHVKRSKFHHQAQMLAEHFKSAAHMHQLNVRIRTGGYGNLLLSRWSFKAHHQVSLRLGRRKPRGAQLAVIETPEGDLHIAHWHLGLAEKERHWQVRHLLDHPLFCEAGQIPAIVVGDSNDWRNTLCKGPFADHAFEQITAPASKFRSFPAYAPIGSLDKAFSRGDVFVREARLIRTPLAKRASDHLPLVIDFHLNKDLLADAQNRNGAPHQK